MTDAERREVGLVWITAARVDLDVVRSALLPLPGANVPGAAYHVQQAAEKAAKALVYASGQRAERTHSIARIAAALPDGPLRDDALALDHVSPWVADVRYPAGVVDDLNEMEVREWATRAEAFVSQAAEHIASIDGADVRTGLDSRPTPD